MRRAQDITVTIIREVELSVTVRCYSGVPATAPSYSSGGEPPEPAHGEVIRFEVLNNGFADDLTHEEAQDAERLALERSEFDDGGEE